MATFNIKWIINETNKRYRYKMIMDPLLMNNPELKVALQVTDDLNLALMIRYYVIVTGDTLPGFN